MEDKTNLKLSLALNVEELNGHDLRRAQGAQIAKNNEETSSDQPETDKTKQWPYLQSDRELSLFGISATSII